MEEEVAEAIKDGILTKPLVAFLGGRTAPKGQKMGHAGAIISGGKGSVEDKIKALTKATIRCIPLDNKIEEGKCVLTGNLSKQRVLFAKAY